MQLIKDKSEPATACHKCALELPVDHYQTCYRLQKNYICSTAQVVEIKLLNSCLKCSLVTWWKFRKVFKNEFI